MRIPDAVYCFCGRSLELRSCSTGSGMCSVPKTSGDRKEADMTASDIFLGCFAFGLIWTVAAVLLGGAHLHGAHGHVGHGHAGPVHGHALHGTGSATHNCGPGTHAGPGGWLEHFLSVHAIAIFLAWMGGCGYLTLRHTRWGIWLVLGISTVAGLGGAITLAAFLRFLHSREFA